MRIAVFSDIHGNAEALDVVLNSGRERGVEKWICLGDIVGYGADPSECITRVRELAATVVRGNHDAATTGMMSLNYFNVDARKAAEWTAEQLSTAERQYLVSLPLVHERSGAYFVHAEPLNPKQWGYVTDLWSAEDALKAIAANFCFVGHSHIPFICSLRDGNPAYCTSSCVQLRPRTRYLANVGSVGQPRDGDWRSCFAIWDQEQSTLELVRCTYDLARTQQKIRDAGLPESLAARLATGY